MRREEAERRLYALEERAYGDVMDAIRASGLPEEEKRTLADGVLAVLCDAQAALDGTSFDWDAAHGRMDAIVETVAAGE